MTEHAAPSFARLLDWVEGRLAPDEAAMVANAVEAAGPDIAEQVAWLRSFVAASERIVFDTPPPSVRRALTARFAAYAQEKRPPTLFQRLAAALSFDSMQEPALAGIRSGRDQPRQLLFATDTLDVVLDIHPRPQDDRMDLLGQILPKEGVSALQELAVQLTRDEQEVSMTMADDLGEFSFAALAPGLYQLIISGEDFEIALTDVELHS
ncbi:MAG: hypothetical protein KJZ93_06310 [Caldilineaceae bacterium]|nr:hypothetical protein [Caldilineaceae bacterium]